VEIPVAAPVTFVVKNLARTVARTLASGGALMAASYVAAALTVRN